MKNAKLPFKSLALAIAVSVPFALSSTISHADSSARDGKDSIEKNVKEGWREGVIDGAFLFNTNLNPLDIDVEVKGDKAILTGFVDSETTRSLAEQVALSVDGINDVDNKLKVDEKQSKRDDSAMDNMKSNVSDAAITAKVKSKLLANGDVSGMQVNVDTKSSVVTLKGSVSSDAERDLAYYLARNTDGVRGINNELSVSKKSDS